MGAKRYVIGCDPGTTAVGVCALEDELDSGHGLKMLDTLLIRPDGQRHFRLFWVHEKLLAFFKKFSDRRLDIAVELMYMGNNPQTAIILGEARGVVLAAAGAVRSARVFDQQASVMKKVVAGHGGASKYQVAAAVSLKLKLQDLLPEDVADAAGHAILHATTYMKGSAQ